MMMKRKALAIGAVMLTLSVGSVVGMGVVNANAQAAPTPNTPTAVQQAVPDKNEAVGQKEGAEKAEPANEQAQEQNLPGGGHQDQGEADHQFEGVE